MLNQLLLPFAFVCMTFLGNAQDNIGMATGNYAGIGGAWFNPSSIVDSRYKFDMTVLGISSYFTNNALEVKNGLLVRRLLRKEPYNGSFDAVKEDLLTPLDSVDGLVKGSGMNQIQFPLSFMANLGPKAALGLNIRNRTGMTLLNLNPATANMLFAELEDSTYFGKPQNNDGLDYAFLNWMEVGFTYGRVIANGKHHFLKGAATAKLLAGGAGIHIAADQLTVGFSDAEHLSMSSPYIQYARTSNADFDTYDRRNLFNNVEDYAFGWDMGFTYELRGKVAKRKFTDLDGEEKERADLNKYFLRVGVALLDVGKFTFERRSLTQDHSVDIVDWDISQLQVSDLDEFDQAYSEVVTYIPDGQSTFTYGLPTAISANVDVHLFGGFYVNAATYRDASGLFTETGARLKANEWTAVTPRFEGRALGLYVPISHSAEETRIGATLRIGPFYVGSTNLADLLANPQNTSADLHAGMRVSIGQGKPTILKKKFEAMAGTQQGVNGNRTRLDSLEREVYALKRVVEDRQPTVVNNFYGSDSTSAALLKDSAVTRAMYGGNEQQKEQLLEENDQLKNELARQSLEQRRDSLYIAELESSDGENKDRLVQERSAKNADRAAAKAAGEQADATADMAKELDRINKRMKRQNTILATGATAGIVAAATSGDKKDKKAAVPDSVVVINDSTAVLGADTIRLVTAPGVTVPVRMSVMGDTAFVTVYDTVRVTVEDTVRDTVRVQPSPDMRPTAPAVEAAPVDDTAMKRLMEPVYFATGRTSLGPQGKVKVGEIAAWLKEHPEKRVTVTGYADASGSRSTNGIVAMERAESVRNELIRKGVTTDRITTERQLAPDGASPSAKDRRAEVRFSP